MKTLTKALALSLVISTPLYAETAMHNHQEEMQAKMDNMDKHLARGDIKKHSQVMMQTIKMSKDMVDAKRRANEQCMKREAKENDPTTATCFQAESHSDTEYKQIVVLLQHVIERQNGIMKKMGMFSN